MARSKSLAELQVERARLRERAAAQRETLAQQFTPVGGALQFGERIRAAGASALQFLRSHPLAMGALAVAVVLRKPRLSLRWARRGLVLWRGWRTARSLAATLQQQLERAMAQGPQGPAAQSSRYRRR